MASLRSLVLLLLLLHMSEGGGRVRGSGKDLFSCKMNLHTAATAAAASPTTDGSSDALGLLCGARQAARAGQNAGRGDCGRRKMKRERRGWCLKTSPCQWCGLRRRAASCRTL